MLKIKLILLLAVCMPVFIHAQEKKDTDSLSTEFKLKPAAFIIPAVFMVYGAMASGDNFVGALDRTTRAELQEDHRLFSVHTDNYIQYAPAAAVYVLNLSGIKGRHNLGDATGIYALSFGLMKASTEIVKSSTGRLRPDGSSRNSFPSGHTATSFASAEFLMQEYKDVSPWIGYAGYLVAGTTGVLRLYNNRHWVSDVVAGAGFGIASAKLGYFIYPHLKRAILGRKATNFSVVPLYQQGAAGFFLSGSF